MYLLAVTCARHRGLRRRTSSTKDASADITTSWTYDASGRQISQTISAGIESLTSSNEFDLAGRTTKSIDHAGLETTYSYSTDNKTTTVTRPGGATEIIANYADGRTESVTGTGTISQYYDYGANADGTQWTILYTATDEGPCYVKTTTDMLGRTVKEERSGYNGTNVTTYTFNLLGRLEKTETTGMADTLYSYDSLGNLTNTCLDVDDDGEIDFSGMDRITVSETEYEYSDSAWWRKTTSKVLGTDNSSTATTTSINRQKLTGLGAYQSHSVSEDIHGNETVSTVTIDRENATVTRTTDVPDSECDVVSVTDNGLLVTSVSKSGITNTFVYDELERRTSVINPRTGSHLTCYDEYGRVDFESDASGNTNFYTYDSAGRVETLTDSLGNVKRFAYTLRDETYREWGDVPYPVEMTYNEYGLMTNMATYRTGTNWSDSTWPGATETPDNTVWVYDDASGLVEEKTYADGNGISYTYTVYGKPATRTWERGITTTYSYDSNTQDLLSQSYSDSTPTVTYTYTRSGQQKTVTDGTGGRGFQYNGQFQVESEIVTNVLAGTTNTITHSYSDSGYLGQDIGFGVDSDYAISYDHDSYGRLNLLTFDIGPSTGEVAYSYLTDSDLVSQMSNSHGFVWTRQYENNRNLMTEVLNQYGTNVISRYEYENDVLGRRVERVDSGAAFSSAVTNTFGYNSRSELTSAVMGSNTFTFSYDPIGNRTISVYPLVPPPAVSVTNSYTANNLNQYTEIAGSTTNSLSYDSDGNLDYDNTRTNVWNGANRLVAVEPITPSNGSYKAEFAYDYLGRRVSKEISVWTNSAWSSVETRFCLWDQWTPIQVISQTATATNIDSYCYGLDLSGSIEGAAGIGGLLSWSRSSDNSTFLYCGDANGNVTELVNATNGAIAAAYVYSPFGAVIACSGDESTNNLIRFSTRFFDEETEDYYMIQRYYRPAICGRFKNRDPIGDWVFLSRYVKDMSEGEKERWILESKSSVYMFVANSVPNMIDPYGLRDVDVYIWEWQGDGFIRFWPGSRVGHVMITEHNSKIVLLSQFPQPRGTHESNVRLDYESTFAAEQSCADKILTVNVPDDKAFDAMVADHSTRKWWDSRPKGTNETHCARAAYDALKAGGVPLSGQDKGQLLPGNLGSMLEKLIKQNTTQNTQSSP